MEKWICNSKGFYWLAGEVPETEPRIVVKWQGNAVELMFHGTDFPVIFCSDTITHNLQNILSNMLISDDRVSIELENGILQFEKKQNDFSIAYSNIQTHLDMSANFSIIDLAQFVEQLFPPCFESISGEHSKIVVAAPHAPSETKTAAIAKSLSQILNCRCVIAWGYRDRGDRFIPHPIGRYINVNRPTEKLKTKLNRFIELPTNRAENVYRQYLAAIMENDQNTPLDLLIEIHGFKKRKKIDADFEITTTGFSVEDLKLKNEFFIRSSKNLFKNDLIVKFDGLHPLHFTAKTTKSCGSLQSSVTKTSYHIEISNEIRTTTSISTIAAILKNLVQ